MPLMPQDVQGPPQADGTPPVDPRQMLMQLMMAQQAQGGGGGMPQAPMPEEAPPVEMPQAAPMSDRDARFGPQNDPARDQTQGELDTVSNSMRDDGSGDIAEELRQAIEDDDPEAVEQVLKDMEEMGMAVEDLPPDVQKQLEDFQGDDAAGPAEEQGESE